MIQATKDVTAKLEMEDFSELQKVSESLLNERTTLVNVEYENTDIQYDVESQYMPPSIYKCMYTLYFTPRPLEGVFRCCAEAKALPWYNKLIGGMDYQCVKTNVLTGVIRDYVKQSGSLWQTNVLSPLLEVTKKYTGDDNVWVEEVERMT
ncbi:hypothetical protein EIN_444600, partial [Entamoeba invadens IP1]